MAIFDSRPKRVFSRIRKLAQDDMVDQAAMMIEDEMDTLMEEKEVARSLLAFLLDIGHPDLAARLSDRVVKSHPEVKGSVKKLLEDRHSQFTRSLECINCTACIDACHFDAIYTDESTDRCSVDKEKCMGCGVCEDVCPTEAISLRRDPSKGDPLDLAELLEHPGKAARQITEFILGE